MQAQRFLALVLLPHVRHDIEENKRCHFALFQAMKKATYKPDAFFKVSKILCLLSYVCCGLFLCVTCLLSFFKTLQYDKGVQSAFYLQQSVSIGGLSMSIHSLGHSNKYTLLVSQRTPVRGSSLSQLTGHSLDDQHSIAAGLCNYIAVTSHMSALTDRQH